jgi:hypothetical protein
VTFFMGLLDSPQGNPLTGLDLEFEIWNSESRRRAVFAEVKLA